MAEYIEREAVYDIFTAKQQELLKFYRYYQLSGEEKEEFNRYDGYLDEIEAIPTADVVEVKHGYWKGKPIAGFCTVGCSVCGMAFSENSGRWLYCPNCGAKMDLKEGAKE